MSTIETFSRRRLLSRASAMLAALPAALAVRPARADVIPGADGYPYEIQKTDAEWLAQLGEHDFRILRRGGTEAQGTSPNWNETREGTYACRGCGLPIYSSRWKVVLDKRWAFFRQSEPNALLMAIDWPQGVQDQMGLELVAATEVHCRRCGSHMGHILLVEGQILHCINGSSLDFIPEAA
jgi:peptide-methionine (R)-S-oxide reductase